MFKHGEIYWVFAKDLDIHGHEQEKSRPYVIVSSDYVNSQGDKNVVGVSTHNQTPQSQLPPYLDSRYPHG
jgi:mRNA-degrading endonuclease toxin of MazEF toxin-antitoxin module